MGTEEVDGVAIVDYATYNEFGTEHIPSRPFMSKTAEDKGEETKKYTEFLIGKMIDGYMDDTTLLQNLGAQYQTFIQQTIRAAKKWAAPNAAGTIRRKGSSSPLIDTARMLGTIRYEVQ